MNEQFQMDLFGQIVEPASVGKKSSRNKKGILTVKWSFSRRNTMETCLRKYFYNYYAAKHFPVTADRMSSIRFLKTLSNQHLVGGKIIHNLIKLYLTKAKTGTEYSLEWLKQRAIEKIQQSIEYTHTILSGTEKNYEYPPFILQEIVFENAQYREIYQEVEAKVLEALENFMLAEEFEEFRTLGKTPGSYTEKKFRLPINEHITLTGETDLAYYKGDNFIINDWKTGKVEDGDDSMQLLTYTLWAIDQIGVDKSKVKIFKSYVNHGVKKELSLSDREIFRNKLAIRQSGETMLEMAGYGENGDELAFTPCRQQKICSLCPFQKICK